MSDDLLEAIEQIMNSGIDDTQRLEHILTSIKSGKKIYLSDKRYLKTVISKNITYESVPRLIEEIKNMDKSVEKELVKTFQIKTSPLWYYLPLFFNIVGGTISYAILRKTDLQKAKKCFIFGLVLFLIPITIFVIINFVPDMQYSAYMVKNAAGEQNLRVYDIAIIDSNIPIENIKVGDVIIFYNPGTHQIVLIHRVVQILSNDPFTIKTKGDNSPESIVGIDYPITKQEYIGKLVYTIPQVGYVTKFVTTKSILIIIATIVGIGVIQHMLYRNRKCRQKTKTIHDI
jgi:signal peptidase I